MKSKINSTKSVYADLKIINEKADIVIFLHGITKTNKIMEKMAKAFNNDGYNTYNISYPSTSYSLSDLILMIQNKIAKDLKYYINKGTKVHFVAHSMGGLVSRGLLKFDYIKSNTKNTVMLGTPNYGSYLSDFLISLGMGKKIFGSALNDLTINQKYLKNTLVNKVDNLGIIAGDSLSQFFGWLILLLKEGKNDGRVSIKSTKLKGYLDFIVVKNKHDNLPKVDYIIQYTINFIKNKRFNNNIS